ncbi:MAG: FkbM family methyltransferase [bacterium]
MRAFINRVIPHGLVRALSLMKRDLGFLGDWKQDLHLLRLRRWARARRAGSLVRCKGYHLRITDGLSFYALYKEIFANRIYHFAALRPNPLILDCGSNIGMSILYLKQVYPAARIIAFEPDPSIFPLLHENIVRNGLKGVQLIQAALSRSGGMMTLYSDGRMGSYLATDPPAHRKGWRKHEVSCVRLRDYLTEPVDFLKMNIEGAEWEVLADSEDRLEQVREMVVEYHYLPGVPPTLHDILALLHRKGFDYLVDDFDSESGGVCAPFILTPHTRYYALIYARRG